MCAGILHEIRLPILIAADRPVDHSVLHAPVDELVEAIGPDEAIGADRRLAGARQDVRVSPRSDSTR